MPLILPKKEESKWLEPDLTKSDIRSFFGEYKLDYIAHTISPLIISRTENADVPEVQKIFTYPKLN